MPQIAPLTDEASLTRAAALIDAGLGPIEDRLESLRQMAAGAHGPGLVLGARDGAQLVGAASASIRDRAGLGERLHGDRGLLLALGPLLGEGPTGVLEQVVVDPAARGRRLGDRLVAERLAWMAGQGATAVVSLAWQEPGAGPARSVPALRRAGLTLSARVPDFWRVDGAPSDYCPRCGADCRCVALLMARAL